MKIIACKIACFLVLFICGNANSQNSKTDSLQNLLTKATQDTTRASLLWQIGWEYKFSDPEKAKKLGEQSLELSLKTGYRRTEGWAYNLLGALKLIVHENKVARTYFEKGLDAHKSVNNIKGMASCYSNLANIFVENSLFDSAIIYQETALNFRLKLDDKKPSADSYNNLGNIYNLKGEYGKAVENLFKAVKIYEKLGDTYGTSMCYYNIGRTYYSEKKFQQGIIYATKSRKGREIVGDKSGIANSYILESTCKQMLLKYDEASEDLKQAIALQKEIGDQYGLQFSYSQLGLLFYNMQQFDLALEYQLLAKQIGVETNNQQAIISTNASIGEIYYRKKDFQKALEYELQSLELATKLNALEEKKNAFQVLSETFSAMKNFQKAYEYQSKFISLKDSMQTEASTKQLQELQTQYDTEKKQKEIELLTKNQEIQNDRIVRQRILSYTVFAGLLLVLTLAILIFKRYREKQKANIEITGQKEIIEIKNKEILDSIHYAKRIQRALLASDNLLKNNLPDHFILYKPKDIVSGDFYWATKIETLDKEDSKQFILATCDCTGHGVPGAFMSLLNISKLNETVNEKKITQPDLIFNQVREEIIKALNSDETKEKSRDGMDAIICAFDFNNLSLQFAAANNSLIIIRDEKIIEYKADKFPVGAHQGELKPFTLQTVELHKGDCVYTFTDGFADQFGGEKGKKLMSKNFKAFLLSISQKSMDTQQKELESTLNNWRGNLEQVDDVLVVGVRV